MEVVGFGDLICLFVTQLVIETCILAVGLIHGAISYLHSYFVSCL